MQYLVVIEKSPSSFGVYVPDLPGCVAVGETRAEVAELIHEALEFHLHGKKEDGLPIPEPYSTSELVEVHALRTFNAPTIGCPGARRGKTGQTISTRRPRHARATAVRLF